VFSDKGHDDTVNPDNLPDDCMLVCRQNFRKFYGDIFADRAAFAASNNKINVNTASWQVLQLLRGVGKHTARCIIEQRKLEPFLSAQDLHKRVNVPYAILSVIDV